MERGLIRVFSGVRADGRVEAQLQNWTHQLHDLSGRNRLLYYRDTRASSAIIQVPEFLELFRLLVEKGRTLQVPIPSLADVAREAQSGAVAPPPEELEDLLPEVDAEDQKGLSPLAAGDQELDASVADEASKQASNKRDRATKGTAIGNPRKRSVTQIQTNRSMLQLNHIMYNLHYVARTVQEEQGFNILYVTFGMLRWADRKSPGGSLAPLVLVPIALGREHPSSPYTIRMAEEDIVVNPVLQLKLSKDLGIELPEAGNDLTGAGLRQFLAEVRAKIHDLEGWEIEERATIGAFNFVTQMLIKDFEKYAPLYVKNPLVRWLSGMEPPEKSALPEIPEAGELDDEIDPGSVFQVLDADSSQQEAIEAAKRGLSFVLQGPPGTGKSQTIANLIAESIMAGKRVLFVSQKMAALEVVQSRLRRKGLADFCLEVHSHRMDKRKVIRDLMSSLSDSAVRVRNPEHGAKQREIREVRDELNSYVRQLHEPRLELGLSLYELYGRLARYLDEPVLEFPIDDLESISASELAKRQALIRQLAAHDEVIRQYAESPWRGWGGTESTLGDRERIATALRRTGKAILELHDGISRLARRNGLRPPSTIGEDMQFMQVLEVFKAEVFSPALWGAALRYKVRGLPSGQSFSLQYGEDSRKMSAAYRSRRHFTTGEVAEALAVLSKIVNRGHEDEVGPALDPAEEESEFSAIKRASEVVWEGRDAARSLFSDDQVPGTLHDLPEQPPESAAEWFAALATQTAELAEWASFNGARQLAAERGLDPFVEKALEAQLPAERWEGAFCQRFYRLSIEQVVKDRPLLQRFKGTTHSDLVRRFRELDLATIEMSAARIKAELVQRKPSWSWMRAQSAETSILRREFNKKRGLKPLRKLFAEIPGLIQALKPCLMMSPLTVCQLLDPRIHEFDLAVFDEASQIPPEYAISAFLRAKQVIVAGDSQQLPPMNFFQAMEEDEPQEDDEQQDTRFESILTLCDSRGFPSKMLNWHYRSRDESLIAYSNFHFYDNRLCTFPSAALDNPQTGLKFMFVPDGVYHPGKGARNNPIEAKRVADLVFQILSTAPELSLGIVTFSVPQRRAIEREIDRLRIKHRDLDNLFRYDLREPLFVKNLENVQGDERDVIILSVGYGRDEEGKTVLNFGPLNRDGGARRLNVAVTRARRLLHLVSSMQPEEIDLARATSQGARLLRSYLETARDGIRALDPVDQPDDSDGFTSPFEESVYTELSKRGLELVKHVGASQYRVELAVKDPQENGRFILGLESDGAMYHSGNTARDRDRLRGQVLRDLGWNIHRIWSKDWIQNRDAEIAKVFRQIQELGKASGKESRRIEKGPGVDRGPLVPVPVRAQDPASTPTIPDGAIPFARPELPRPDQTGMRAFLAAPLSQIVDALQFLANNEGPIAANAAKGLLVRAWGTRRVAAVDERLDLAMKKGAEQGAYMLNGTFLWPMGRHVAPLRVHVPGQPVRPIAEIAPEEIEVAVRQCVKGSVTIRRDDLARETARLFGLRNSSENSGLIDRIMESMLKRQVLLDQGGKISAGAKFPA